MTEATQSSHELLAEIRDQMRDVIEPWIGVRADIIPQAVQKIVVWYNDLSNFAWTTPHETREHAPNCAMSQYKVVCTCAPETTTAAQDDDPLAGVRWICPKCRTVNPLYTAEKCLGCGRQREERFARTAPNGRDAL